MSWPSRSPPTRPSSTPRTGSGGTSSTGGSLTTRPLTWTYCGPPSRENSTDFGKRRGCCDPLSGTPGYPLVCRQLCFDGENIRSVTEDASSGADLGAAIKALFRLDLVERLIGDATVLQTRLARQAGTPEQRAEVEALEAHLLRLAAQDAPGASR